MLGITFHFATAEVAVSDPNAVPDSQGAMTEWANDQGAQWDGGCSVAYIGPILRLPLALPDKLL